MHRRRFAAQIALAAFTMPWVQRASAAADAAAFRKVEPPVPVSTPAGKIDVVEFFSYACPHCKDFEPVLEAWAQRLPADVVFHRIPVPFLFNAKNLQPLYYTLEAMNLVGSMQAKVFQAIHLQHRPLERADDIAAFVSANGIDATKFMAVFDSFTVRSKVQQAAHAMDAYGIDSVPMLAIQGKYLTSPGQARGEAQALAVVDQLLQQIRSGRG